MSKLRRTQKNIEHIIQQYETIIAHKIEYKNINEYNKYVLDDTDKQTLSKPQKTAKYIIHKYKKIAEFFKTYYLDEEIREIKIQFNKEKFKEQRAKGRGTLLAKFIAKTTPLERNIDIGRGIRYLGIGLFVGRVYEDILDEYCKRGYNKNKVIHTVFGVNHLMNVASALTNVFASIAADWTYNLATNDHFSQNTSMKIGIYYLIAREANTIKNHFYDYVIKDIYKPDKWMPTSPLGLLGYTINGLNNGRAKRLWYKHIVPLYAPGTWLDTHYGEMRGLYAYLKKNQQSGLITMNDTIQSQSPHRS